MENEKKEEKWGENENPWEYRILNLDIDWGNEVEKKSNAATQNEWNLRNQWKYKITRRKLGSREYGKIECGREKEYGILWEVITLSHGLERFCCIVDSWSGFFLTIYTGFTDDDGNAKKRGKKQTPLKKFLAFLVLRGFGNIEQ